MKVNVLGLLGNAARSCRQAGDTMSACGLYELGNNLRLVMRGEESMDEFKTVYIGADKDPFDIDKLLPTPKEEPTDEEMQGQSSGEPRTSEGRGG